MLFKPAPVEGIIWIRSWLWNQNGLQQSVMIRYSYWKQSAYASILGQFESCNIGGFLIARVESQQDFAVLVFDLNVPMSIGIMISGRVAHFIFVMNNMLRSELSVMILNVLVRHGSCNLRAVRQSDVDSIPFWTCSRRKSIC